MYKFLTRSALLFTSEAHVAFLITHNRADLTALPGTPVAMVTGSHPTGLEEGSDWTAGPDVIKNDADSYCIVYEGDNGRIS